MPDARFDFPFAIRILNAARHGDGTVVCEHVAVQRIERGIVDVGDEHALAQVIQHDDASHATQPAKSSFVQLGPDPRTGTEHQQAHRLAAVTQRQHEQPRAPVLAGLRIAHHGAGAVIDLRFFARRGVDHRRGLPASAFRAACARSVGRFGSRR